MIFDPEHYGSSVAAILAPHEGGHRLMPLTPRSALEYGELQRLRQSSAADLFTGRAITSQPFAECVRSALFLYFSALEESHKISQSLPSRTGSFLHGIMHRQEPNFSNSKYWFRKVPDHEMFPNLRVDALRLLAAYDDPVAGGLHEEIERKSRWDPTWFVDNSELAHGEAGSLLEKHLMEIQRAEWQLLFDFSYRQAAGS